ncbi:hypothetical protein LOTGIDRAFT_135531 [Lottia gigantea]|uniref:Sulfatase N-terminal domain-containing protein n=1 Tax=Lottia gigantea TaxID=225164 RepID=V3ZI78_LOTGI|nr:hypothetical protein LOTGIDRAFT_135531 [Lottia gigantea]ESO82020.1 hypothetical protein LOTGIDRAFT_135531 [Lottia gigantea]
MTDEFVRVVCYDTQHVTIFRNYHAFIIPNRTTSDKIQRYRDTNNRAGKKSKPDHLNVMMIGVDSVARLNLIAKMPKTRSFLLNTLKAVELEGYTKIADNSFPNAVALLTGNFFAEEYDRLNITYKDYYDGFNTLFKSFSQKDYITLYGEDQPEFGTFNPEGTGFVEKPTDFYLRPFTLAMNQDWSVWNNYYCVVNRPETNIILDYTFEFWKKYPDVPKFSYTFNSRLTHDGLLSLSTADEYHYNNLVRVHRNGFLNNTVLVFFADHGFRGGSVLDTDYGQIQTRMPMMYFVFPKWFPSKYPNKYINLLTNRKRLTAPFDVHATIMEIRDNIKGISRSDSNSKKRGLSLFDEIPVTRICDEAGIIPHWCVCKKSVLTSGIKGPFIQNAGEYVVQQISEVILKDFPQCSKLHLSSIQSAYVYTTKVGITKDHFQAMLRSNKRSDDIYFINIVFATTPGGGVFEATVKYSQGEYYATVESITRLNKYGTDGRCVSSNYFRPLCHCLWFW